MRFHSAIPYLIAAAGLVQVGGSPIRIVTLNTAEPDLPVAIQAFRLGRPAADAKVATIPLPAIAIHPVGVPTPETPGGHHRGPCGKFRTKALAISNTFRKALGMPPINIDEVRIVRVTTGGIAEHKVYPHPHPAHPGHHHHGHHRGGIRIHHHNFMDQPFTRRVHFALSSLGPWEGRAVAFVLGCGIGVLLRMLWVLAVISYRFIRGSDTTEGEYQHILFEQYDAEDLVVAPPAFVYVDEKAPIVQVAADKKDVKEKETK